VIAAAMNKAFVKDPEPLEPRGPSAGGCDGMGVPVSRKTLLAQLPLEAARRFSESAFYCPNPACDVAYFDTWGTTVSRSLLRTPAYPKSATAPICSCFGITAAEIEADAEAGRKDRLRDLLAKAESDAAECETRSPSGASCAAEARRLFLRHFAAQ
jgi:hypothetical protein